MVEAFMVFVLMGDECWLCVRSGSTRLTGWVRLERWPAYFISQKERERKSC